jgi:hypothetical protein
MTRLYDLGAVDLPPLGALAHLYPSDRESGIDDEAIFSDVETLLTDDFVAISVVEAVQKV